MSSTTPTTLELRVRSLTWAADGVLAVELVPAHPQQPLPPFDAGSHIDLHLPLPGGAPVIRSYSLCNAPGEPGQVPAHYVVGVGLDRASRGGSRWVHQQLRPGQVLQVGAPRNHFKLNEAAPQFALVAGGIGVTPMLAMARRLNAIGKPVQMLYAARNVAAAAFADELAILTDGNLTLHLDDQAGGPPDLASYLGRLPKTTGVYCCGPAPMLGVFEATCLGLGLQDAHIERFSAAPDAPPPAAGACTVVLGKSGRSIDVQAGTSILDALLDAGVDWPYSCKEGVCGTCETRVISGDIDHRDGVLSAGERAAGNVMMPCVSGCKGGQLVLDI